MSVEAMSLVWQQRGLSPMRKLILLRLADHADTDGKCFPSLKHIAEFCECSVRTVSRSIAHFEEIGIISHHRRFNKSNIYQFDIDKMSNTYRQNVQYPLTECPIPIDKLSSLDGVIGHGCLVNMDTGDQLIIKNPQEQENQQSTKQIDKALESEDQETSEVSSLGNKPSWVGLQDISGYVLRKEPKPGTLIRNPHTGVITEYEK